LGQNETPTRFDQYANIENNHYIKTCFALQKDNNDSSVNATGS